MGMFKPATKEQSRLRLALVGPSGSGKTYTALKLATALGKTAVIDTERGSASKYADEFQFDVLELTDHTPAKYIEAIKGAQAEGYEVVVIDSLTHAWQHLLEEVDKIARRSQTNNKFTAWADVTPKHTALIDAIVGTPIHIIATMRSKSEYVLEEDPKTGKMKPRKIGLAPIQRDGMEYEFDILGEMTMDNDLIISKTRCTALNGQVINKPGGALSDVLKNWLMTGTPKHWALNGGGVRINALIKELKLTWDDVKTAIEPGRPLERLSDTTLADWQVEARIKEIAEGKASH